MSQFYREFVPSCPSSRLAVSAESRSRDQRKAVAVTDVDSRPHIPYGLPQVPPLSPGSGIDRFRL
jgi:hypothetical protein